MTSSLWMDNAPVSMVCEDKWFETSETISLRLSHASKQQVQFKPGQFVSLGVEIDGKMEYRAYSISSVPNQSFVQLTVKRVNQGKVSNFLIDQFKVGDEITVLAPTGPFNSVDCQPKKKVALLSAGCGVTPVMSMARSWLANEDDIDITFIHMAKSPSQTIYFDDLEALDAEHDNFKLQLLLKDSVETSYPQGRLNKEWLSTLCPDVAQRTVYLCGPIQFMQDMEANLAELGVPQSEFYQESFTPIEAVENNASGVVQFEVPDFGVSKAIEQGTNLADVLEEAGVPIIIACRSGMCGSCKCKVTKGEVSRSSTETLSEEEIAQGYTLACSTQIQSDVEVSLG